VVRHACKSTPTNDKAAGKRCELLVLRGDAATHDICVGVCFPLFSSLFHCTVGERLYRLSSCVF
jgi:hypothetical protein